MKKKFFRPAVNTAGFYLGILADKKKGKLT